METKHFLLRLIPSRPTFMTDMSDEERQVMIEHQVYWSEMMRKGMVVVYGPVMDPAGPYGLGVVRVATEEELQQLMSNDPASKINKYEYFPMMAITTAN